LKTIKINKALKQYSTFVKIASQYSYFLPLDLKLEIYPNMVTHFIYTTKDGMKDEPLSDYNSLLINQFLVWIQDKTMLNYSRWFDIPDKNKLESNSNYIHRVFKLATQIINTAKVAENEK
jgi:hypothetical protein